MNDFRRLFLCLAAMLLFTGQPAWAGGDTDEAKILGDVVAAAQAWQLLEDGALLVDVRSAEEFAGGSIEGATNIPHTEIEKIAELIGENHERPVVLYCRSGGRAGRAQEALEALGYTGIFNGTGYTAMQSTKPACVRC